MDKIKEIKGAIFDMDGTLIDTMWIWEQIDIDFLGKRGINPDRGLIEEIGHMSFNEAAVFFKKQFKLDESLEDIMREWDEMAYEYYSAGVKLKEGAREYLEKLKNEGVKIGLATASKRGYVNAALKGNDILHYFQSIWTVGEVGQDKSTPAIYLKVCEDFGLEPEDCAVFEDIYVACLSAKQAGMKVVGVYDRYAEGQVENIKGIVDLYIEDFTEII